MSGGDSRKQGGPAFAEKATVAADWPARRPRQPLRLVPSPRAAMSEVGTSAEEPEMSMRERVERVLEREGSAVQRLGEAGTSITFVVLGGEQEPVTLLLDRVPPQLATAQDSEITVELDADHAQRFMRGQLVLSTCLIEGGASCRGPIRKYLVVDPILRRLLAVVDADGGLAP